MSGLQETEKCVFRDEVRNVRAMMIIVIIMTKNGLKMNLRL